MPNFLAMSFEGQLAPGFDLLCLQPAIQSNQINSINDPIKTEGIKENTKRLPDGWGIGFYPGGEPAASVLKEASPSSGSIRSEIIKTWQHLESPLFMLHIRSATWGGISAANTQPFCRSFAGRDFLLAHSGSLSRHLPVPKNPLFEPVGSTDSELLFCTLLAYLQQQHKTSLGDCEPSHLLEWIHTLNEYGNLTIAVTDGRDLLVYADRHTDGAVYLGQIQPPYERIAFGDADVFVDLTRRGAKSRKGIVIASNPLEGESMQWRKIEPGSLVLIRQGALLLEMRPGNKGEEQNDPIEIKPQRGGRRVQKRPEKAAVQRYSVLHRTAYRYTQPVEHSTHLFRLEPVHDKLQSVIAHECTVSVPGQERAYQDVFGNQVRRVTLDTPFHELIIEARSIVSVLDTDPLAFRPLRERTKIPLTWMPWQWHMLQPFLLPPELPESELRELLEYAMSFVERNDYDLLDTLLDLNDSIFHEYQYKSGSTTISTTPFEVYSNRYGVCQDFSNLFICLSRLLGVPARYVCGYVYTGPAHPNQRQSDASHAWLQVYLPEVGWRGFDPTNGTLTQTDHIRVAVGRSYVDATPTSGTIYVGGGGETLDVAVRVERLPPVNPSEFLEPTLLF